MSLIYLLVCLNIYFFQYFNDVFISIFIDLFLETRGARNDNVIAASNSVGGIGTGQFSTKANATRGWWP